MQKILALELFVQIQHVSLSLNSIVRYQQAMKSAMKHHDKNK